MRLSRGIVCGLVVVFAVGIMPGILKAEEFKIAVLKNDRISAQKYEPLIAHIAKTGITVSLVEAPTYRDVAKLLSSGEVDAMFNGPGIAGSMIVIHRLKQQRVFVANFKKDNTRVQNAIPSQNRIN
jgi:ABC-type phosphate/phosphonate transport system substrate-binding protein